MMRSCNTEEFLLADLSNVLLYVVCCLRMLHKRVVPTGKREIHSPQSVENVHTIWSLESDCKKPRSTWTSVRTQLWCADNVIAKPVLCLISTWYLRNYQSIGYTLHLFPCKSQPNIVFVWSSNYMFAEVYIPCKHQTYKTLPMMQISEIALLRALSKICGGRSHLWHTQNECSPLLASFTISAVMRPPPHYVKHNWSGTILTDLMAKGMLYRSRGPLLTVSSGIS